MSPRQKIVSAQAFRLQDFQVEDQVPPLIFESLSFGSGSAEDVILEQKNPEPRLPNGARIKSNFCPFPESNIFLLLPYRFARGGQLRQTV